MIINLEWTQGAAYVYGGIIPTAYLLNSPEHIGKYNFKLSFIYLKSKD